MSYVFQILKINSNSLVSLSLNNVGITGLVLDNCPNLSKLSGTDQDCIYFLILLYQICIDDYGTTIGGHNLTNRIDVK